MNVSLLYNWEDSVEHFFEWVEHCCGVKQDSFLYVELMKYIKTMDDLDRFIDLYDGNMYALDITLKKIKFSASLSIAY
ncbi:hypothetical protein D3P07_00565 [Paenibacillus sp. 1011MAR3C5]|uniref:hypothetical protein n=1 Tax=Paenibacillus sp. 1011MAR3C5 TaxID=1675787 RepID=UPI000E6CFD39|nr:hypothetical protein [Paenibacillus sp. 1011MAR3C5]RJE90636.1 hypothetical protein D3P07_00565 [Paenibacillus sp. 1011MAR3C5]